MLFVGTKKQARDAVKDAAEKSGMPYVNHRWLGGLLTNFQTINQRIKRLHDLERYEADGQLALLPTRERMAALADLTKLRANLGGVKNMTRPPNAMVVIDLKVEEIAVREAQRLRIPIIGLVDTNCDPDGIEYVVPGNDDAIRSCALIINAIGDVVGEGSAVFRAQEEQARKEAEEQQRAAAEERARRDAEEKEAREAAEREAAAAAKAAADAAKTQAEGGGDRQVAEAEVAAAVQSSGRKQPDPVVRQAANKDVAPAQRDNVQGGSPAPAPPAEDQTPDPASPPAEPLVAAADAPAPAAEAPAAPAAEAPAAEAPAAAAPAARLRRLRLLRLRGSRGCGGSRCGRRGRGSGRPGGSGRRRGTRAGRRRGARPGRRQAAQEARRRARRRRSRLPRRRRPSARRGARRTRHGGQEVSTISAKDVKALRDQTGAGMMDCKRALVETDGDMDAALELLKVQLGNKIGKLAAPRGDRGHRAVLHPLQRQGRRARRGRLQHRLRRAQRGLRRVRQGDRDAHRRLAADALRLRGGDRRGRRARPSCACSSSRPPTSPSTSARKIAEGKLRKWMEETVLLKQPHVNGDKYDGKTIEDLRAELSGRPARTSSCAASPASRSASSLAASE